MARVNPLQAALNAGELSPRMAARVDFSRYASAGETCENLLPIPQGGLMRRPGTRFIREAKDSSQQARLLRFEFSTIQAYVLEMGAGYVRFYRNQGVITVADTDAAISNGTFASNITGWDDRSTGGAGNQISHDSTNGRLTLETGGTAADDIGWAEQAVTTTATNTEHVIKFRVLGAPGDKIEFQIGTATLGAQDLAAVEKEVGYHCVAFTPTVSPFYVQFRNLGSNADKDVQIDEVSLIDNAPVEVDTPYAVAELFDIKRAQSADVLYLAHPDHPVYKLARSGHTSWSLVEVAWQDGPYLDKNTTTTTLTASVPGNGLGLTVTASATAGINSGDGFKSTDVGRALRIDDGSAEPGWGVIASVGSTTVVLVDVKRDFVTTAQAAWSLGAWSGTTGYPLAVAFFEQRLLAANTANQPQTFWLSQSADLENMRADSFVSAAVAIEDDDGLTFTIAAERVNAIRWCSPGQQLVLGTAGGEWIAKSQGDILTPTDIDVKRQTTHGSANIEPIRAGHAVLFVQRAKEKVHELAFSFEVDGFRAPDLTILSDHVLRGGVVEMDYQQQPDSLLWCVRADGVLAALTYKREQEVVGWSRHKLGGSFGAGDAVVESVAVIPGNAGAGQVQASDDRDEVWVLTKRTIGGATVRHVEMLEGAFAGPVRHDYASDGAWQTAVLAAQQDAFYVDSGLTYDGAATTSITGLDHLEGETVSILADGAVHPDKTVSAGAITLDAAASKVQAGLAYTHAFKSLKLNAGAAAGTAVAKTKRVRAVGFVLLDSGPFSLGPTDQAADLEEVTFREVGDAMDTAVPLFTGERVVTFDGDWETDARIHVRGAKPTPFTLLALAPEMQTNEMV